jgi:hypothetical protein
VVPLESSAAPTVLYSSSAGFRSAPLDTATNIEIEEVFRLRKLLSGGLVVIGVAAIPVPMSPSTAPAPLRHEYRNDPRLTPLRQFFLRAECPAAEYAVDFLMVADEFALDWRLLPSLSFVESTGGKASPYNNLFGWDSGRAHFATPSVAIRWVGSQLATSTLYRSKSLDEILATYNPYQDYPQKVKSVMRRISTVQ